MKKAVLGPYLLVTLSYIRYIGHISFVWHYGNYMRFLRSKKKRIYLDYAAATPVRIAVHAAMRPYQSDMYANPSAIHTEGVLARQAVETAREKLARTLKIRSNDIVFTGSGTESNNLAILGAVQAQKKAGKAYEDMEVISTKLEHPSVGKVLEYLLTLGVQVTYVDVDAEGLIIPASLQKALSEKSILVSFAYVNSEIGTIQEVGKLARIVRAFEKTQATRVLVHVDAAQAPLWLPCQLDSLLVDILTLDAGKCYGPKGVGVIVMRHGVELAPVFYGGSQETGLRPATENVAGIVGAVESVVIAQQFRDTRATKVTEVRDKAIEQFLKIDGAVLNGPVIKRVANNINISIPGIDSEFAVISLDAAGIACSTKSACSGASGDGSSVVFAITNDSARATSTIRLTLGEETTAEDLTKTVAVLTQHVLKMRAVKL